ncbi:MAG TPA: BtpA/SgcQ family protein [Thermoanaerobaculia bacterium]|nr:BtpA/SgcQ family protein [Thermoanaerobaculia bacterium]
MLTRAAFAQRFATRAVFGMVHLRALPGAPQFTSMDAVIDAALRDARAIAAGGCDGLIIENFGDRPFTRGRVEAETIASMARAVAEIAREVHAPFGVNVLRNDALSALGLAAATGASFIRVNVYTGAMLTDQGIIEGDAYATLRRRASLAPHVLIFADHMVKHAVPVAESDPLQMAKDLRVRGLADALIVTGVETGAAVDPGRLRILRDAVDAPLLVGSGLTAENAAAFADADGAIVGTAIKREGRVDEAVDPARVEAIVRAFKNAR